MKDGKPVPSPKPCPRRRKDLTTKEKAIARIDKQLTELTDVLYSDRSMAPKYARKLRKEIDNLLDKRSAIQRGEIKTVKQEVPQLTGVTYGDGRNRTL